MRNLKVITFGMNKNSNIYPIKIARGKKLVIKVKNQIFTLKIKNINIYNVLSSLAVLKELNLDIKKVIKLYGDYEPTIGRGKYII